MTLGRRIWRTITSAAREEGLSVSPVECPKTLRVCQKPTSEEPTEMETTMATISSRNKVTKNRKNFLLFEKDIFPIVLSESFGM